MAACLDCLDNLTLSDLLRLVTVCDGNGTVVAIRTKEVAYTESCTECGGTFNSLEDYLRKSLWCDDNGVYYIQTVKYVTP